MQAIRKTANNEIIYKFTYKYKNQIIEEIYAAKKGVIKLADAWVKTVGK